MADVQLARGGDGSPQGGPEFVDVLVEATGEVEQVPAEWVGHPVLGRGISLVPAVDVEVLEDRPTGRSTTAELEAFAENAGIDLGAASTNAERLQVIDDALDAAAAQTAPAPTEPVNPDVQLVMSTVDDQPFVPAARVSTQDTDDTGSSTETPATGDEEN